MVTSRGGRGGAIRGKASGSLFHCTLGRPQLLTLRWAGRTCHLLPLAARRSRSGAAVRDHLSGRDVLAKRLFACTSYCVMAPFIVVSGSCQRQCDDCRKYALQTPVPRSRSERYFARGTRHEVHSSICLPAVYRPDLWHKRYREHISLLAKKNKTGRFHLRPTAPLVFARAPRGERANLCYPDSGTGGG